MKRFLVPHIPPEGQVIDLSADQAHHALRVLRVKGSDRVELLDGAGGSAEGEIVSAAAGRVSVRTLRLKPMGASGPRWTLMASVIKPERMEWLIEKATELGVHRIVPVLTQRSVVRLSAERWKAKVVRFRRIAEETCKQCGRPDAPEVLEVHTWKNALGHLAGEDLILVPTLEVKTVPIASVLSQRGSTSAKIMVWIGPEGDFTVREAEELVKGGAVAVSLGSRVLRSETAALFVLSNLGR